MKHYIPATIIAALVYFCMSFFSDLWFEATTRTTFALALWSLMKTAIFTAGFHVIHGFLGKLFGFYDYDPELDAPYNKTSEDKNDA
ncbi:hypothetical protein SAMN06273572_102384 [Monaibacterium marinum]|uniref:Uncharacterized protein n=1 Tax=Pontivivens marinum TaxID=1690039 RepID=A0A2C9CQR7_9RHOB|nr:hypothetical protein [Monaibacterium marinum]SOH93706.1 hypothetical protein SAMN06273572_102384 [Monaibacterium marinum]